MSERCIELIQVTKAYRSGSARQEKIALKEVSLTIRQGEFIGLIGQNGSGKSTLVRLLNGLLKPTSGTVRVNGLDTGYPKQLTEIRRLVGMVFQNPDNQIVCPVVEEEVAFGPENLGLPVGEIKKRTEWAIRCVGLDEMKNHAPHLLSGGQRQKLAIASVLAMLPDYLILDEPSSMLDPIGKRELLAQLKTLNQQNGITIVFISHNLEDLIQADRIIVMDQGSIYLQGTPQEVFGEEEKLEAIGLEAPGLYQLMNKLNQDGYSLGENIKTVPDLVEAICQL